MIFAQYKVFGISIETLITFPDFSAFAKNSLVIFEMVDVSRSKIPTTSLILQRYLVPNVNT